MAASSALAALTVNVLKVVPQQPIYSKRQAYTIVVLAAIFCGSILAGNASLRYLPISFNQVRRARRWPARGPTASRPH